MRLAFFHDQNNRRTICAELPAIVELSSSKLRDTFWLSVGVALVSPKDPYVKKVGREISESRLAPIKFTLESMIIVGDVNVYILSSDTEHIRLYFKHKPGTNILHLGSVSYAN